MDKNPRIEKRPNWDEYYAGMCEYIAQRSLDSETQVGCVVVNEDNIPKAIGYNSFPAGCRDEELPHTRPDKYPYMAHSEGNALDSCREDLTGGTIYVPFMPCDRCFQSIIRRGIKKVKYYGVYESGVNNNDAVITMAEHRGIELVYIGDEVKEYVEKIKSVLQ